MNGNALRTFPLAVLRLENLTHLHVDNNELRHLPCLTSLQSLTVLHARDNQLRFVGSLPTLLTELLLSDNPISQLPELQHLTNLSHVEVCGVPCIPDVLQQEIVDARSVQLFVQEASPILRARRAAGCLLAIRWFRKSALNAIQKDVIRMVARCLLVTVSDTEAWWDRYKVDMR